MVSTVSVRSASVNLATERASVDYDPDLVSLDDLTWEPDAEHLSGAASADEAS